MPGWSKGENLLILIVEKMNGWLVSGQRHGTLLPKEKAHRDSLDLLGTYVHAS